MIICLKYYIKVLDKIKTIIGIEIFNDTKILIDTDDQLLDDITLINVIIMICVVRDDGKFYPQMFLEVILIA